MSDAPQDALANLSGRIIKTDDPDEARKIFWEIYLTGRIGQYRQDYAIVETLVKQLRDGLKAQNPTADK